MTRDSPTTIPPTWRESRAPKMIREAMSRPMLSVPKGCLREGGSRASARLTTLPTSFGWGAMWGAKRARSKRPTTIARPNMVVLLFLMT